MNVEWKSEVKNKNVTNIRIKERTSYQIGWMRIDLTVVSEPKNQ
jgi:hypothetical protein